MKYYYLRIILFLITFPFAGLMGQSVVFYGCDTQSDTIVVMDTVSQQVVSKFVVTLAGQTIEKLQGLAWDPIAHETYCVSSLIGQSGRELSKIDLQTGVLTSVGDLGDRFASITFRDDGQLMGVTGDGGNIPFTVFLIDKTNASTTLAKTLGNGDGGELIGFNPDDQMIYHWSGSSNMVFEKFPAYPPYTPLTNIPITNGQGVATIASLYIENGNFITANSSNEILNYATSGSIGSLILAGNFKLHGFVMPPDFEQVDPAVCVNDTMEMLMTGLAQDTVIYHWGDGSSTSVFPAGGATHTYSIPGNRLIHVALSNPSSTDTVASFPATIQPYPGIPIIPGGGDVAVCDTNAVQLIGPPGGIKQWYRNGVAIPGETGQLITVTTPGVYNIIKTNTNGCTDSADVGANIMFGITPPPFDLGPDTSGCEGALCFTVSSPGHSFLWSDGTTSGTDCPSASGVLSLAVLDSAGCKSEDSVAVTVFGITNPMPTADTAGCPLVLFAGNDPNSLDWLWDFGDGSPSSSLANPSHTYATVGNYTVSATGSNECFTATQTILVTVDCTIGFEETFAKSFRLGPNPSNGDFVLHLELPKAGVLNYTVRDIQGREVYSKAGRRHQLIWNEEIALDLIAGIYFLEVEAAGKSAVFKLLIQ